MRIKTAVSAIVLVATAFLGTISCEAADGSQGVPQVSIPSSTPNAPQKATQGPCGGFNEKTTSLCEQLVQHPWYVTVDDSGQNPHNHPAGAHILESLKTQYSGKQLDWAIHAAVVDFRAAYLDQTGEQFPYKTK